ncbi:MAG: ABC transporter substrate-binding protein [Chloroflexota bacterium]
MITRKWHFLAALVVGSMLLAACAAPAVQTVVVTLPAEVQIVEVTATPGPPTLGAGCTYNAYRLGWVMDYADANNIVNEVFHPDSPFQYSFWDDATFRDLVDQALVETDPEARAALWQQAEDILVTDYAAVIPLFHYDRTGLVRPEIEYEYPPFGQAHYMRWRLPAGQTTLRVQLGTEPPTLDINLATDTTSHAVLNQLMEGPYRYTGAGTIEPAGALSYEVSADGLVYTIHLREDGAWWDGQPVTAQHYVDGVIRLLKPETGAEYAYVMYYISGAEAFNTGETDDPSTVGIRVVDDYTLEVTLDEPQAFFDSILAFFTFYPVRLDVIEQYGDEWTEPGNFVGNGPFVLTEWAHEDHLVITKNPAYHGADEVTIERVEYPIIVEDATALAAYERGELDVSGYPAEDLPRILEEMPGDFVRLPYPGVYYLGMNTLRPPTDNLNFRMALASAIDKRAILDAVLNMPWRIEAYGVIAPEIMGYQGDAVGYGLDLEAAQGYLQAALAEMGIEDPAELSVNLWYNRGGANDDIIEAVAEQWETNLGITVNVVRSEWGAYLETLDECHP